MGVGVFVGVWIARYLGPAQFGLLNYATAFIALFTAIATLGLNGIVVRDLIVEPGKAPSTLGTAFALQIIGGLLAFGLAVACVGFLRPHEHLAKIMIVVLGAGMMFKATEVVKYWFEAKVQAKYGVWVENGAFLVFALVKVSLLVRGAQLMAFVWAAFAEGVLVAAGLLAVYVLNGQKLSIWRYRYKRAKGLLSDSWPLILSGLAVMVYMRVDQIMLGQMLGDEAVGIFSAAVRLSEIWYFIPVAICASVFPAIIEARRNSVELYYLRLKKLFELMVLMAVAVAIIMSFISDWVVNLLYGPGYQAAAPVLVIHIWTGIFVFLGVASSRWFIAENLQRYSFYRTLAGGIANVILNFILIPKYGVTGSAWATVISQAVASVFFNAANKETRIIFSMQIKAIIGISFFHKS